MTTFTLRITDKQMIRKYEEEQTKKIFISLIILTVLRILRMLYLIIVFNTNTIDQKPNSP